MFQRMKPVSPPATLPVEYSAADLQYSLNLTAGRLVQLDHGGIITRTRAGFYAADSIRNYIAFLRRTQDGAPRDWQQARVEVAQERAALLRLERRQKEGELLSRSDVTNMNVTIARTIMQRLMAVPASVAARLVGLRSPAEGEAVVRPAIEAALSELAALEFVVEPPRRRRNGHTEAADRPD
jgi:hypothetical protein